MIGESKIVWYVQGFRIQVWNLSLAWRHILKFVVTWPWSGSQGFYQWCSGTACPCSSRLTCFLTNVVPKPEQTNHCESNLRFGRSGRSKTRPKNEALKLVSAFGYVYHSRLLSYMAGDNHIRSLGVRACKCFFINSAASISSICTAEQSAKYNYNFS